MKMNKKMTIGGIIAAIIATAAFFLAHNFYNDPLLKGGVEFLGIPLYIIISFFIILYIVYYAVYFLVKLIINKRHKSPLQKHT